MKINATEVAGAGRRDVLLIALTCLVILLTRIPWIVPGYGVDADAYRVVNAAREISQTDQYSASRLPGYPIHEYLTAFTPARTSPVFSNGLTMVFSCVASVFFALILRFFRIGEYVLLTLAFAMTPVVYINSVCAMDYMFAVAFMLGGTWLVLTRRHAIAGICLGLAMGCRMTSGALLLPLVVWILTDGGQAKSGKAALIFATSALLAGALCFVPVLHRYGMGFFTFYEAASRPAMSSIVGTGVLKVWGSLGSLGFLGLAGAVLLKPGGLANALTQRHVRRGLALSASVVLLYVIAFLRLPNEAAYLIPAVPFVLLAAGLVVSSKVIRYFAIALLLSSFFVTIERSGPTLPGPIIQDHRLRVTQEEDTERIVEAMAHLGGDAIIVAGARLPLIRAVAKAEGQKRHEYIYLIEDLAVCRDYLDRGREVYFLPGVDEFNLEIFRVDLRQSGARPLPLPGDE